MLLSSDDVLQCFFHRWFVRLQKSAQRSNAFSQARLEFAREAVLCLVDGTVADRKVAILEVSRQRWKAMSATGKDATMNIAAAARANDTTFHAHQDMFPNLTGRTQSVKASTKS